MVLQPPSDFWLTNNDKKTERFVVNVLGGVPISDHSAGSLSYYSHVSALTTLQDYRIYVVGELAEKTLRNILPHADIVDIQTLTSFKYPKELPTSYCGIQHNPRYCSLAKMAYIQNFIQQNPPHTWNEIPY
jgi:hypothetical protein